MASYMSRLYNVWGWRVAEGIAYSVTVDVSLSHPDQAFQSTLQRFANRLNYYFYIYHNIIHRTLHTFLGGPMDNKLQFTTVI